MRSRQEVAKFLTEKELVAKFLMTAEAKSQTVSKNKIEIGRCMMDQIIENKIENVDEMEEFFNETLMELSRIPGTLDKGFESPINFK